MSGANTDGETVDEAADDEHGDVLGSTGDDGTNAPDDGTDLDGGFTTELVGDVAGDESTKEGSTRHGGSDTALDVGGGTRAAIWIIGVVGTLVEVAAVLLRGKTGGQLVSVVVDVASYEGELTWPTWN